MDDSSPQLVAVMRIQVQGRKPDAGVSRRLLLKIQATLSGRLVSVGSSLSFDIPRGHQYAIVHLRGRHSATMTVGRITCRTHVQIEEATVAPEQETAHLEHQIPQHGSLPTTVSSTSGSAVISFRPANASIFPAQRRGYEALCALLSASLPPHADAFRRCSIRPPSGALLSGPPGTGKTHLVRTVAATFGAPLVAFSGGARSILTFSGADASADGSVSVDGPGGGAAGAEEAATRLRAAFLLAARLARRASSARGSPVCAILFLDELDALCPKRSEGTTTAEQARCVAMLLTLLDGFRSRAIGRVLAVAASNRPHALDEALRRPGRLEWEIPLGLPSAAEREAALRLCCRGLRLHPTVDLELIGHECHGCAAADLIALVREAALSAARAHAAAARAPPAEADASAATTMALREGEQEGEGTNTPLARSPGIAPASVALRPADWLTALGRVRASVLRASASAQPPASPLRWDAIGGVPDVKRRLRRAIEWPLTRAAAYRRLGVVAPRGVLLHGPPGCAKTSLARAAAGASGVSFHYLSGAALYSPYVGEAERQLRELFSLGRACAPALIFLDELDAIVGNRGGGGGGGGGGSGGCGESVQLRVLSTLLNEMDGIAPAAQLVVIGATNRLDTIDAALLRPGRFDELIHVPLPDGAGRAEVLRVHTRTMPLAPAVHLDSLAARCEAWSGAQLAGMCREAAMQALRENLHATLIEPHHFDAGYQQVHGAA